jgi:hypothetical protein
VYYTLAGQRVLYTHSKDSFPGTKLIDSGYVGGLSKTMQSLNNMLLANPLSIQGAHYLPAENIIFDIIHLLSERL